jgi:P27 family predicted phage terminase small subunit
MPTKDARPLRRPRKVAPRPPLPPERLAEPVAAVWREVVEQNGILGAVDTTSLEAYCTLIVRWREAAEKVAEEGLVVDGGRKGAVVHPALAAERQLAEQVRQWAPLFKRSAAAKRRRGPMYDATKKSIAAVPSLQADVHAGPVEAVLTLAWLIDEAQREGLDALQRASFVMIPAYIKACGELQITPATAPAVPAGAGRPAGKVSKFADAAQRRRSRATG